MTVIAFDGHILAADRKLAFNDLPRQTCKIRKSKEGTIMAGAGNWQTVIRLFEWYNEGAEREDFPYPGSTDDAASLILLNKKGQLFYILDKPVVHELEDDFMAFGSGSDLAMGAMAMGASAIEAVGVASKYNLFCGIGINYVEFKNGKLGKIKELK